MRNKRSRIIVLALAALIFLALACPRPGSAESEPEVPLVGVSGVASGAAASAGPRAIEPLTMNVAMTAAVVAAGTGAMIIAGGEFITISAAVAAAGALAVVVIEKQREK